MCFHLWSNEKHDIVYLIAENDPYNNRPNNKYGLKNVALGIFIE